MAKNTLKYYDTIAAKGYDGSHRIRPQGGTPKTISIHMNSKNALSLAKQLMTFIEDEAAGNVKDSVFITVYKEKLKDDAMRTTITAPKEKED